MSVELAPNPLTIVTSALGGKRQLRLIGTYSDGTTRFLTESATWSSSLTGVATISTTAGTKGLVTTTGYGTTTITTTVSGLVGDATLTVAQPAVTTIALTPATPTIASGTAIQLQATATFETARPRR